MKRYHFFYGVTISCLLLFNVILFFYSRFLQATVSSVVTTETNDGYMNDVVQQISHYLKLDGKILNDTLSLVSLEDKIQDLTDRKYYLKEVLKEEAIICYYPLSACRSCLEKQLIKLDNVRRLNKQRHIVVLTDLITDDIPLFLYKNNIRIELYEVKGKNIGIPLPKLDILLFTTIKNRIKNSFLLNIVTEKYDHFFYEEIKGKHNIYDCI